MTEENTVHVENVEGNINAFDDSQAPTHESSPAAAAPIAESCAGTNVSMAPAAIASRDAIRAKIFSTKPKTELIENFYGVTIELRQPSLEVALEVRNTEEKAYLYQMLVDYAYIPGTQEKLFTEEDIAALKQLPFGDDMTTLMGAVNRLLGIDSAAVAEMLKDATKSD